MTFSPIGWHRQYDAKEIRIMRKAHMSTSEILGRHRKEHEHSERLARLVMDFFDRGIGDAGILATLAVNRDSSIERGNRPNKGTERGNSAT